MDITTKTISFGGVEFEVCGSLADPYFSGLDGFMGENALHAAALRSLPTDAVIVDIGANIGATIALAAAMLPRSKFVALEPSVDARACLAATIAANGLEERVQVLAKCVGAAPGLARFSQAPGSLAASHIWDYPDGGEAIEMVTLDQLTRDLDRVDFIKIDVEGWELDVLQGGVQGFARLKPLVLAELNSWTLMAIRNISPRMLLDHIRENYGPVVMFDASGAPEVSLTSSEYSPLLFRNVMDRHCVDDILFSPDRLKIDALARSWLDAAKGQVSA